MTKHQLARDLVLYTCFRVALVTIISLIILGASFVVKVHVPLAVVVIFALIIALPLATLLTPTLRQRLVDDIAQVDSKRRKKRVDLRNQLSGEDQ